MKQKLLCLLLVAALCCALLPSAAAASPAVRAANALYTLTYSGALVGSVKLGAAVYKLMEDAASIVDDEGHKILFEEDNLDDPIFKGTGAGSFVTLIEKYSI